MTPQERLRQRALNLLGDDHAVSPSRPVADTRDAIARATERFGSPERVFGDEPRRPRRRRDAV